MSHEQGAHKSWVSRICYAIGNLGQAAYYNALSTFFVTYYAAQTLFRDYEAEEATAMIGIITALVFIIRIVEIFGLRVKMCVWLGVSRGLDLAFLNAD